MENSQRIAQLFFLYTLEELTIGEEEELTTWRKASPRNEDMFLHETNRKHIAATINEIYAHRETIFEKIKARYPGPWEEKPISIWNRLYKPLRIAASILLIFASTCLCYYFYSTNRDEHRGYYAGFTTGRWFFKGPMGNPQKAGFNAGLSFRQNGTGCFGKPCILYSQ